MHIESIFNAVENVSAEPIKGVDAFDKADFVPQGLILLDGTQISLEGLHELTHRQSFSICCDPLLPPPPLIGPSMPGRPKLTNQSMAQNT
jgi:hypothetical protein